MAEISNEISSSFWRARELEACHLHWKGAGNDASLVRQYSTEKTSQVSLTIRLKICFSNIYYCVHIWTFSNIWQYFDSSFYDGFLYWENIQSCFIFYLLGITLRENIQSFIYNSLDITLSRKHPNFNWKFHFSL